MASSAPPNEVANTTEQATSPPTATQHITPTPASPAPAQEKHPHSYYGPQSVHQPPPGNYFNQYPQSYGQPVQGYVPPPPPAGWQPNPQTQLLPEETRQWRNAHIGLHIASVTLAVVDIALSLSLLKWGFYSNAFNGDLAVAIYVIGVPILILLWSAAELLTRWFRTAHRGIHPGAHVGVSLILWLGCALTGGLLAALAPWIAGVNYDYNDSSCWNSAEQSYEPCNNDESQDERDLSTRQGIFFAIVAVLWLLWALYFAIFVRACIETQRRNQAKRPVVYVPYWAGPAAQGWQPLSQQNNQEPPTAQNIPMQTRTPVSNTSSAADPGVTSPAPTHQVQEYYTPGTPGMAR